MQVPLSLLIFFISLIMVVTSDGERGVSNKEWSSLLDPDSQTINGVGTWKARFMSDGNVPVNFWNKSKNKPMIAKNTIIDKNSVDSMQFTVTNSYKLSNKPQYNYTGTIGEEDLNSNETIYNNWKGNKNKQETYSSGNYTQPRWQLPVEKFNFSRARKENLTVFPLSIMHKIWQRTDRIRRRNGDFDDEEDESEIGTFDDDVEHSQDLYHACDDQCLNWKESRKNDNQGDSDTGETQMYHGRGGMGGGKPILLIKDQGDSGGDAHPSSSGGKESLAPLMMMLMPLMMMCIMMPMMMTAMAGMMNFMKTMTTLMIMTTTQGSAPTGLPQKHRKSDEDGRSKSNEYLNSFIQELSERLEAAISKYGDD